MTYINESGKSEAAGAGQAGKDVLWYDEHCRIMRRLACLAIKHAAVRAVGNFTASNDPESVIRRARGAKYVIKLWLMGSAKSYQKYLWQEIAEILHEAGPAYTVVLSASPNQVWPANTTRLLPTYSGEPQS